jgi:hypothetical protein
MNKIKISVIILISMTLYSCGSTLQHLRSSDVIYNNTISGNYSSLSRCILTNLQNDNFPLYDIVIYPDNKTAEIVAHANSDYFFEIKLKQQNETDVIVNVKRSKSGYRFVEKAHVAINKCSSKNIIKITQ